MATESTATIKHFFKRAVTENLGLKLIALLITLGLFIGVRLQEKVDSWVDVEVIVRAPPTAAGVVLSSEVPDSVRVLLRGRGSLVDSVKEGKNPQVVMDLSGQRDAGSTMFYFEREMFGLPSGIELVDTRPEAVLVRTERVVTRRLPVRVRTFGRLKGGTELLDDPVADPTEVVAFGAASIVRALNDVQTEEVDIEGLGVGDHSVTVPLRLVEGLEFNHSGEVTVDLKIRWTPGQRMLSGLLVQVAGTDQPTELRPAEVAVSLAGPQVALDRIDPAKIIAKVVVDEEMVTAGGVKSLEVKVEGLTSDVEVKSIAPATVLVNFSGSAIKPKKGAGQAK
jgi:YbbR domain-containing protein